MKKKLLSLFLSFAIIPFSYSQIVDQPDVAIGNIDLFGTVALGLPAQQSFEAEITGDLTKIELSVYGDSKMDIIVEIYSGSFENSDLATKALASKIVTAPAYLGTSTPYEILFANTKLEEGKMYTIQISTNDQLNIGYVFGEYSSNYKLGNYTIGGATDFEGDAYFKTYIKKDVAIGNIDLFGTVALGLPAQQSFEAEITGDLTKIELSVYGDSKMDIIVEIYSGSFENSDLGTKALASKIVTAPAYLGTSTPYEILFANTKLEEGKMYTIQISTNDQLNIGYVFGEYSSNYKLGNYTIGGTTDFEGDAYFKTYIKKDVATTINSYSETSKKIALFPNPSNGQDIHFISNLNDVHIFNVFGLELAFFKELEFINTSEFVAGTYFLTSNQGSTGFVITK